MGESDFAFFGNYACRVEGGAILFCRSGSADATVNQYQGQVRRNTMVLLLPGSIFMLTDRTEDFRAAYCSFSRDLFSEAAFRMDPSFFHALRERPDLPSAPADRRGGFDLAPDGGLHLPRPRQRVPQYDHQEPFAESAAGELRQDAAFRSPAAPRAGDDYAAVGAVPPFRRSRARALRPGARSVVLRRQTLHFDPLPVDHRAQRGAQFGQGVHRPFGDAGDQE